MKTALITGGAGFIGRHLCEFILGKGFRVIAMDNLATGEIKNIEHLRSNPNFKYIHHDVSKHIVVNDELDFVLHFASPASPVDYQKIPIQTLKAGSLGTHNTLGLALAKKAKYMLASTSEVYGDPLVNPQPESYWGNVNPVGVRGCFSEDTEVLTINGWKNFKDISKEDYVATLNPDNFNLQYHKPLEVIKEKYNDKMYLFENFKIDLLVTPNHKMYVQKNHKKNFQLIEARENINWEGSEAKTDCIWDGKEIKKFYLPKINNNRVKNIESIDMETWLEFFGYYISEGCVHIRNRKQIIKGREYTSDNYNILIAQDKKNKKNYDKIRACLEKLPFNFFTSDDHQFRIVHMQLGKYLIQFGKASNKYIPDELKQLSKRQLLILFNALMLGDGNKKMTKYYTKSKRLADDIQEIALKIGLTGKISKPKSRAVYYVNIRYKGRSPTRKDNLTPLHPKPKIVDYSGNVYCVNVKNHIIYVRRNGKPVWCGNCYDEAKRFAEALTMAYHRIHKIDTKIVRIFNTYGPRMRKNDGRAVPNFINQALKNEPITVYGDGKQTRSFCYVSDLIKGVYKLMMSSINEPVNLGNPEEHTILEFAELIKELTKSKSKIVFKQLPLDDPHVRCPDIKKAKKELKWEPKVSLREGLMKTIEWFKEN
ncbi:GDP-mannose 4,6-dehydratase [Candidatus Woesearchaeota archaeon]|nr:GDP-mannose 4,6-dehydratase [Candidatus Woesearchaeota archaeon]